MTEGDTIAYIDKRTSSIEITENAKGQYSSKVKLYFDREISSGEAIVDEARRIQNKIKAVFKDNE